MTKETEDDMNKDK